MQSPSLQNESLHKWLYFFIALAVLVNFSGLFVPLMDPDAGVYASISKNMVLRNDYVNLWFQDHDWLDKPHFPFWITALCFKIFGIHDWSYKLPGILFSLLGGWYTFLFAKQHYNKTIALWAVFILLTAEHFMISNNDVRAEPFLTGLIIASVYHFSNALSKTLSWQLVIACLFAACCVMTKGVFTLLPIGGAVAGELIIKKESKQIFNWRWIIALILVILFISPELYSLWLQFDSHPEKIVFGKDHVSGIRFFLWDSQFGRFMNTGPIKGKGDPTFFIHTVLWAFLPWSLIMYAALFSKIRDGIKKRIKEFNEWYTIAGSLLTLIVFSISKFQLPYYSNIVFPFLAILTAHFIWQNANNKALKVLQTAISVILLVSGFVLLIFYKPAINLIPAVMIIVLLVLFIFLKRVCRSDPSFISYLRSGLAALIVTLFLNLIFYPDLLKYQSGNEAAFYINKNYPGTPVARIGIYTPAGEFYLNSPMGAISIDAINKRQYSKGLLLVTEEELKQLETGEATFEVIKEFKHFHVTMLKLKFLNPKTREQTLEKRYLIKLL